MGLGEHELFGALSLLDDGSVDRIVGLWISVGQRIVGRWIIVWSEDCDLLGFRLVGEL